MRILITNDDGIAAPGLAVLHDIAHAVAGPGGDVWTVAPAFEQSGVGHCISYTKPVLAQKRDARTFAVEGSPADTVLAAGHFMDVPPDLVLSGINSGNNSAENTVYSGTIGAAMEASLAGIPAIALSQFYGPRNTGLDDRFEASRQWGERAVRACLAAGFARAEGYALFYNVNFPPVPSAEVQGLKATPQGYRGDHAFQATPMDAPNRRTYLCLHGKDQQRPTAPGTDAMENLNGWVSITPMRCDLTARDQMAGLDAVIKAL